MGAKMQVINTPVRFFHKSARVSVFKDGSGGVLKDQNCFVQQMPKGSSLLEPNVLGKKVPEEKENVAVDSYRMNEVKVQMIPKSLHQQIFKKCNEVEWNAKNMMLLEKAKFELDKFRLLDKEAKPIKNVHINLPELCGENIAEHFYNIGLEQSEPYKTLLCDLIQKGIPEMPEKWVFKEGWTRYKAGEEPVSVTCPCEDALVFDVEVAVTVGQAPTLAVAVSSEAWYGWVSQGLIENKNPVEVHHYSTDVLIPMTDENEDCEKPKIIVGHYVSYDRARIKEEYLMKSNGTRFLDTASFHISIGGKSSTQKNAQKDNKDSLMVTSFNGLKDLYKSYCQKTLSKDDRDVFVTGSLDDIRTDFQNLMRYCARDVMATYEIVAVLFPTFLERFPHPVTLAGMLEMGKAYLTVTSNFQKYVQGCEEKFEDFSNEICSMLAKKCNDACRLMHNNRYKNDLWMWNEDWSTVRLKLTKSNKISKNPMVEEVMSEEDDDELKELMKRFCHLFDLSSLLPRTISFPTGYPAWYRKLCRKPNSPDWTPGPYSVTTGLVIAPKILNLSFDNYPLHFDSKLGWGILVADLSAEGCQASLPYQKLKELTLKNTESRVCNSDSGEPREEVSGYDIYDGAAIWSGQKVDNCAYFFRLPHKDGATLNVRQPLSKSFCSNENFSRLSVPKNVSDTGLQMTNKMSYWRNNRDRVFEQMVVWMKPGECANIKSPFGVIIPKLVVCGTLTRRAVERLWLTTPSKPGEMLGSELRALVEAPPGYHFIGADVDSQELWIASILGDSSRLKIHGCTPFGWMTVSGSKENGTDLHSSTAEAVGITRQQAKVINYARLYGAAPGGAMKLLKSFDSSLSRASIKETINKMYALTKGVRVFRIKDEFRKMAGSNYPQGGRVQSLGEAMSLAKKFKKPMEDVFEDIKWEGGIESEVYNEIERISRKSQPETPFLKCRLTRALEWDHNGGTGTGSHSTTRANWVVQSGAVDFLHLLIVSMKWLTRGKVKYCLSVHDEVRYLVRSEDRYKAALALQIAHLLTRSFLSHKLGMNDLPMSVAFFSSVEIDKVLRKDCDDDCVTPSNPHGLEKGYGIGKGESCGIYQLLEILKEGSKAHVSPVKPGA